MLVDSPLHSFKIHSFLPLKGDDFIVAEKSGTFCYYERQVGDLRTPFKLYKNNLPTQVDTEMKWHKFLETQERQPFLPITGMEQIGEFIVYTTTKKQIMRMRIQKEKNEDFGKISYLTTPFHKQKINVVATCMKKPILATAAQDQTLMVWDYTVHPPQLNLKIVKKLPDII